MPSRRPLVRLLLALALAAPGLTVSGAAAHAQRAATDAAARPAETAGVTTVILVRHAEKADVPGNDPPLSAAGERRSLALVDALRDAGVQAVVTTQLQRTRRTAAPLARLLGLEPEVVAVAGDAATHARQVAEHVLSRHAGRTVLVVGHSNTVPAIVAALGAPAMEPIDERVYDDFVVVLKPAAGPAHRVHVRYGSAEPVAAPARPMAPPPGR